MEETWVNKVIVNFFSNNVEHFGENSTYRGFESVDGSETKNDQSRDDGFCSLPRYGRIIYQDKYNKVQKSEPVMLKIIPTTSFTKYLSFQFINEMNFYTKIVPALSTLDESFSSLFPKFYHGEMIFDVREDKSAMILEDLKFRGFKMAEKKSFLDFDHLMLMMRKLGQFHAFSYKAKTSIPELFYPLVNSIPETNFLVNWELRNRIRFVGQRGVKHMQRDPKYEKYTQRINTMLEKADDIYVDILTGDKTNPLSVLCHGDYLRNNVLFRYENDMPVDLIIIDLATCRFTSPVLDLLGVLYMTCDQQTRNTLWNTLIDEYYTALKETFTENQVPTKSAILSEFVDKSFYIYMIATYYLVNLIADDYKIPLPLDHDQNIIDKFLGLKLQDVPAEIAIELQIATGGEPGTQVLSDILKDMIDRGFICK